MEKFYALLRYSINSEENPPLNINDNEWSTIYELSVKQSVVGILFDGIQRLNAPVPSALLFEWLALAEQIKVRNKLLIYECAKLTRLFEDVGHQTTILKGQANARLYDGRRQMADGRCNLGSLRQPGDIDIWVSGGKDKVVKTLRQYHLIEGDIYLFEGQGFASQSYHHIDLPTNENGVEVEVHFRPSSGNKNPLTNRRLQKFLNDELAMGCEMVDEGFRIPSIQFSLVMQLSHIQRHMMSRGIGLRQIVDYYFLLRKLRVDKKELKVNLGKVGLNHIASAVMWLLHEKLGLPKDYLIAPMDERRGRMLLDVIMEGGDFGHHNERYKVKSLTRKALHKHLWRLKFLSFDAPEIIWREVRFTSYFLKSMPERIRRRSLSLGKLI